MDLQLIWFVLLGVLLIGYAILDGFDFGVGMMHLRVAKTDEEKRLVMNSIGPLWDGNEVWLVTFGGALFAAFPEAYATTFSAFYLPFHFLLVALIFRATALEFRSKHKSPVWRGVWDVAFMGASALAPLLMGTAVGNALVGLPIDEHGVFRGTTLDLLQPYPLSVGVLAATLFALHGSIYLYLKTEGELQERLVGTMWVAFGVFLVTYIGVTIATLAFHPEALRKLRGGPRALGARRAQRARDREHPARHPPRPPALRFPLERGDHRRARRALRCGALPEPRDQQPRPGLQPHDPQRLELAEHAQAHGVVCAARDAHRADVHGYRVLDLPRESAPRRVQLLRRAQGPARWCAGLCTTRDAGWGLVRPKCLKARGIAGSRWGWHACGTG